MKESMKAKLVKLSMPLLAAAMGWGTWVGFDIASFFFFGEYEYPSEQ